MQSKRVREERSTHKNILVHLIWVSLYNSEIFTITLREPSLIFTFSLDHLWSCNLSSLSFKKLTTCTLLTSARLQIVFS